jgi:hypothetical protein
VRIPKEYRPYHQQLMRAGATHHLSGQGHNVYVLPNGRRVTMAQSPSDWRSVQKVKLDVRRALA